MLSSEFHFSPASGFSFSDSHSLPTLHTKAATGLTVVGNGRNNILKGGRGDDVIRGKGGNDKIDGGRGADQLFGDRGNDTLSGGADNDLIFGGKGNDQLLGGGGNDTLSGGGGRDLMTGGNGRDRFVLKFKEAGGLNQVPVITDFATQDRLQLVGLTFSQITLTQTPGTTDTLVQEKATGKYLAVIQGAGKIGITDFDPTEAEVASRTANRVTVGATTLYIGLNQVSSNNQDPWVASFTNGSLNWYRSDYEITPDDGRGTNLVWDGGTNLYAAFTATGTQGTPDQDFRRFATAGWLKSYSDASPGGGGGGKVAILAKLDPLTGEVITASFLTALNGTKTNSVSVQSLSLNGNDLVVQADSAFAPRKADKTAMTRNSNPKASPNYTVEFAPDLGSVVRASAVDYS
jgi:RTX calcium-binding nonapeptide repeat (4 copies)